MINSVSQVEIVLSLLSFNRCTIIYIYISIFLEVETISSKNGFTLKYATLFTDSLRSQRL